MCFNICYICCFIVFLNSVIRLGCPFSVERQNINQNVYKIYRGNHFSVTTSNTLAVSGHLYSK